MYGYKKLNEFIITDIIPVIASFIAKSIKSR